MFYERLYEALEILLDFFHADQKGLSMESLKTSKTTYFQIFITHIDHRCNYNLQHFSISYHWDMSNIFHAALF
jgi:hypothetical protein